MYADHKVGTLLHCNQCSYSNVSSSRLNNHKEQHISDATFLCQVCSSLFKTDRILTKHIIQQHKKHYCDKCEQNFQGYNNLIAHRCKNKDVNGSDNNHIFTCETCGKTYQSKACLYQHVRNQHSKKEIKCTHCDIVMTSKSRLTHHLHIKHQNSLSNKDRHLLCCKECDFVTHMQSSIEDHVKTKHLPLQEKITCEYCNKTFSLKPNLKRHLQDFHNIGKGAQEFKCPEDDCDYVTQQKHNVSIHVNKVHQGVKFSCNECSYSSGYKCDLKRHIKVVHQGLKFKCEFCDYTTHSKTFLTGHTIKSHSTKV